MKSRYKKDYLQYDLVCGITTGIIAIPQGMANALMANLPPVYGLYGAIMPVFIHSLFTTSSQLHVGPYAVASIMCASTLSFLDFESQREEYIGSILMIAVISGVFLSLLSFLRLGVITRVLSNAVVTGFTAASAIQIISSQLGGFWDVRSGSGSSIHQLLHLFSPSVIAQFNWYAFAIGVISSVLLYAGKQLNKKYCPTTPIPLELGIVILFILLTYFCDLKEKWHIKIIGDYDVVKGFPPFSIPLPTHTLRILPGSLMISIICFSTQVSLGKSFAQQFQYRLDANQELLALGMSQFGGAFFSSLPGSASISRSSVVASIGGKSPVFSLLSPLVVLVCLFFFMDWIAYLPNSVLVTVVIVNLIGMLKRFAQLKRFYQCCKPDFWSFVICTIVLVFFGAEYGLIAGVLTSLGLLLLTIKTLPPEQKISDLPPDNSERKVVKAGQTFHFLNCDYVVREVEKEVHTVSNLLYHDHTLSDHPFLL